MKFSKREVTRRQAITAALGTLAASYPQSLRAAEPTAQEKARDEAYRARPLRFRWHRQMKTL